MNQNINSKEYWDWRFSSLDWIEKGGRQQTSGFATAQVVHFDILPDFNGEIIDFGCGLGDALPIYKQHFPNATFIGIDISQSAIDQCVEKFGNIARFIRGDYNIVPETDVIIASNVLEHLSNDREIAGHLLSKCKSLYIIVPYKEQPICSEHVNFYDEKYFSDLKPVAVRVFPCKGWTQFGLRGLVYNVWFKNIFRYLFKRTLVRRNMQILFQFVNQPVRNN